MLTTLNPKWVDFQTSTRLVPKAALKPDQFPQAKGSCTAISADRGRFQNIGRGTLKEVVRVVYRDT